MAAAYTRPQGSTLRSRLTEPRRFIQVLAGPRQTGKTTIAHQALASVKRPVHYVSADEPSLRGITWIEQEWEVGRSLAADARNKGAILILDEIQKIPGWSETVKRLWDTDSRKNVPLKVVLLGSAPLLVQQGLTESLAGRFEIIPVTHWSFAEMHKRGEFTAT